MYRHPVGSLSRGAALDVGLKCVHSCRFCYYSYLDQSDDQFRGMRRAKFRTTDECKEILRLLQSKDFVNFDYTGGEPTLHPDIVEITRYAHQELGLKGRIITLGQFLMKRTPNCSREFLIDDLLDAGIVNFLFSTHAVESDLFHRITGGKWDLQEQAMCHLDDRGFQYTTNTTVFEWNYQHLPTIAKTLIKHQVYLHNFIVMNAYYGWNRNGRAFGVQARYSDVYPYLREAVEILEAHKVGVNIRYAPLCMFRGLEKHMVGLVGVRYDPYEWMNQAGHFGGSPEFCASMLPVSQGQIDPGFKYQPLSICHPNGVEVIGARGNNVKHFTAICRSCKARAACDGLDPNYLQQHGAGELTPYTEGEWAAPVHKQRADYMVPFVVKTEQYEDIRSACVAVSSGATVERASGLPSLLTLHRAQSQRDSLPDFGDRSLADESRARHRVSVVIPCYNYGRYLPEAVSSVLGQTYRDFEIIIVNDGSTDETTAVADALRDSQPGHAITVIHQENSGQPAHSRNRGIAAARGEYILCLDADDMIAPTMLEECITLLDSNPDMAIAYTDRQDFGGVSQIVVAGDYDFAGLRFANQISYCALFHRKVWESIGGYRTNVKGCEDWDFWVAAGSRGYYGRRIPKPLFLYRRHDTGVYQDAIRNFRRRSAQIIINNSEAYQLQDIVAAKKLLESVPESGPTSSVPLVSVIIPTYNRPDRLKTAVQSVLQQTYPNVEIVVVNDGGVDVESTILSSIDNSRITYVRLGENRERSAARNVGMKVARGTYIAYLDDDDLFDSKHVETLVAVLESSGDDVVYSDALRLFEVKEGDSYIVKKYDRPYSRDFDPDALLVSNYIPILCLMHSKSCIDQVGMFDEQLSVYEDWDFLIRLSMKYRLRHVPKVTCAFTHRRDGTSTTSSPQRQSGFATAAQSIHRRYADCVAGRQSILSAQARFVRGLEQAFVSNPPVKASSLATKLTSIIIVCLNQSEYTKRCVESIARHTPEPHEIIFIDNGSTDDTSRILSAMARDLPHTRVIKNSKNLGFAAASNQGIAAAQGETIVLLNNDVLVTPGWLAGLLRAFDLHPELGAIGPRSNFVGGPQLVPDVPYKDVEGLAKFAGDWARAHSGEVTELAKVMGLCVGIRRGVIDRIGGLDPRFYPGNFEDDDYCIRARLAGFGVAMVNDVFIHHFGSRTFKGEKVDWNDAMQANWTRFKAKWGLPAEMTLERAVSLESILKTPFDPDMHFVPLPALGTEGAMTSTGPKADMDKVAVREKPEGGSGLNSTDRGANQSDLSRARFMEKWGVDLGRKNAPDPTLSQQVR